MKKVVIFGAKEFECRLKYYIDNYTDDKVSAFCVDEQYRTESVFCGVPVICSYEICSMYPPEGYEMLVGIGYKNMNDLRMQKTVWAKLLGYRLYNLIHRTAFLDKSVSLGGGNIILGNVFIDYKTQIGDGNIIEIGTHIAHECKIGNYNYLSPKTLLGGKVILGNNNFCGLGSIVRSAVNVESYVLLGAASYADRKVGANSVIVPARSKKLYKESREMEILYQGEKEWIES